MRRFTRILCPIDFSDYSRAALRYAAIVAACHDSAITVLFVTDPLLNAAAAAAAYDVKRLAASTAEALESFVDGALGERRAKVSTRMAHGTPAAEIARIAATGRHDLIVLGSRGLSHAPKWFFGSTTERVLRTAKVPVLVVSTPQRRSSNWERTLASWPGERVLVPIDLDDYTPSDVRAAVAIVRRFEAEPVLVHAVRPSPVPAWLRVSPARHDARRVEAARRRLASLARTVGAGEPHVLFGDAAEQIASYATSGHFGLIVFTVVKPESLFGPRQGSITYKVVASAVAPVLAVPSSRRR